MHGEKEEHEVENRRPGDSLHGRGTLLHRAVAEDIQICAWAVAQSTNLQSGINMLRSSLHVSARTSARTTHRFVPETHLAGQLIEVSGSSPSNRHHTDLK